MKNKYTFNQEYFKTIDTEEKAYILGFLYADGNLSNAEIALHSNKSFHAQWIYQNQATFYYFYISQ